MPFGGGFAFLLTTVGTHGDEAFDPSGDFGLGGGFAFGAMLLGFDAVGCQGPSTELNILGKAVNLGSFPYTA